VRLVIVPAALVELQAAAAFYTAQVNVGLARAFVDEFERAVNLIASSPQLGATFRGNRRRYFLRKFPYSVIYQITQDELRILALAHQRRRPTYWTKRK
jgi:plasmid stabilization system protein ParE